MMMIVWLLCKPGKFAQSPDRKSVQFRHSVFNQYWKVPALCVGINCRKKCHALQKKIIVFLNEQSPKITT